MFRFNKLDSLALNQQMDLTSECFEKYGLEMLFIPRTTSNESLINGDYLTTIYETGTRIYVRQDPNNQAELGTNNSYSKFGFVMDSQDMTFYCSIKYLENLDIIPKIGDLLFSEMLNSKIFEITSVTFENENIASYRFGAPISYKILCKLHNIDSTSATYSTGNTDIDTSATNANDKEIAKMNEKIFDKIDDNNIVDDSETNIFTD